MIQRLVTIFGFLCLIGYVGILVFEVPRLDLALVVGVSLALAIWDLFRLLGETRD